jgi:hypothetical protein
VLAQRGRPAFERLRLEACFGFAWICHFVYLGGDVLFDRSLVPIFPMGDPMSSSCPTVDASRPERSTVVLATYNERENLRRLLPELLRRVGTFLRRRR